MARTENTFNHLGNGLCPKLSTIAASSCRWFNCRSV